MIRPDPIPPSPAERPGVPLIRTWSGVYLFVFAVFVITVALLAWFSRAFL